jgi:hypothetical protein
LFFGNDKKHFSFQCLFERSLLHYHKDEDNKQMIPFELQGACPAIAMLQDFEMLSYGS